MTQGHSGEAGSLRTADFDYHLPPELIAQEPLDDRSASRLLVLERETGRVEHRRFREIGSFLRPGDLLVVNDTRVSAFRLRGRRPTGAAVEALFLQRAGDGLYRALMKPGRRLRAGDEVLFGEGEKEVRAEVVQRLDDGSRLVRLVSEGAEEKIRQIAETPLPPYVRRPLPAGERYQTVYGAREGSTAAPTAGLHFTAELLEELKAQGVGVVNVTLHIGASTFRPVRSETLDGHRLEGEWISLSQEAAEVINNAQGRVIAVGTTSVRTLEAAAAGPGRVRAVEGETDLFIKPGHRFQLVQGMVTNFHMPRSTLLVLVCAFAGREKVLRAYQEAVRERYRFLSLGDAMLIL
ncbi:MAG: tRNA preQ1(34) S-adenosylmethionine ribosyltransferase-isomerase QueA [Armatimonadota bacterium]